MCWWKLFLELLDDCYQVTPSRARDGPQCTNGGRSPTSNIWICVGARVACAGRSDSSVPVDVVTQVPRPVPLHSRHPERCLELARRVALEVVRALRVHPHRSYPGLPARGFTPLTHPWWRSPEGVLAPSLRHTASACSPDGGHRPCGTARTRGHTLLVPRAY